MSEAKKEAVVEYSLVELPDTRFCGRCQRWVPDVAEIHFCVKAKVCKIGYAWYEPDEPAIEKNSIITDGRPFKPGALIARFEAG